MKKIKDYLVCFWLVIVSIIGYIIGWFAFNKNRKG